MNDRRNGETGNRQGIPFNFSKKYAEELLDSISNGKPIKPRADVGWTCEDMLQVSGALLFAITSHGTGKEWTGIPEADEAIFDRFKANLHAVAEWQAYLMTLIHTGYYSNRYEEDSRFIASATKVVGRNAFCVKGDKGAQPK